MSRFVDKKVTSFTFRSYSGFQGRDGFKKLNKEKIKVNRLNHESKRNGYPGINSFNSYQNEPMVESWQIVEEDYIDLINIMRSKILFPKEVLNPLLKLD